MLQGVTRDYKRLQLVRGSFKGVNRLKWLQEGMGV